MAFQMKGQGATEYLVLLAVVLIIALVSIALLGFFPGLSSDAKITQSASYWKGARPFAILEHSIAAGATNGKTNGSIILQSTDATGSMTINSVKICSDSAFTAATCGSSGSDVLGPGETKRLNLTNITAMPANQMYDLYVVINYTTPNGIQTMQYGGKTLTGKYT